MRTSGNEHDFVILLLPVAALVALSIFLVGGPDEFMRRLDQTVLDSIRWAFGR
jgi:hypothetical protein